MSSASFRIISTIRYDSLLLQSEENSSLSFTSPSPIYMLVYHRDRLMEAAQHFEFPAVVERLQDGKSFHEDLSKAVQDWKSHSKQGGEQDSPLKLRVLFSKDGTLAVECTPTPALPLTSLYPPSLDPPRRSDVSRQTRPFKPSPLTGGALDLGPAQSLPTPKDDPWTWKLKLDTAPTSTCPATLLKTTARDLYNVSRSRALPTHPTAPTRVETIMYNECNEFTEGSITSLYFYRGGRWVTPPVGVPAGQLSAETLQSSEDGERWDEGELRRPFAGRWGHSVRSSKVGAGGQRGTTRRWALLKGMCMEEPISVDTLEVGEGVWVSNGVIGFGFGRVVE
ncbi:hypothetical protein BU24DRAFT_26060 [Aaosphaeria arxii CBS 175.79]|uniref:D-aminoacid aminotransferase-like PLP-dependent enzyme n=1 Tax=Aaosphaeria arxii CBS 175.79 TaxID=1450172 RepID=A0A6A5Y8Z0_9PLEO|nr:uncharacterized protein BU24DRAFT_26060 [Aaosphaeria arxii CBS 175.79]KAF2021716.1 hypothetical protein BU24DRAFT_26060 [Aaosphaeria arxii CBS 175.79]